MIHFYLDILVAMGWEPCLNIHRRKNLATWKIFERIGGNSYLE